jgi:hypothetical protein
MVLLQILTKELIDLVTSIAEYWINWSE